MRPATRASAAGRALLSLACLVLLLAVPLVASGVERTTVFSPAADAVVKGGFSIIVEVDAEPGETIDTVEVQLNGPSNLTWNAARSGPQGVDGVQRWRLEVDPFDAPGILSNGPHRLTARPIPSIGEPPPFTGHEIVLAVPISTTIDAVPDPDDGTRAIVSWFGVDVPDLIGYRIERRPDAEDGRWVRVGEVTESDVFEFTDAPEEPGAHRYRVVVIRSDGADGEVLGASGTRGVLTDPDEPRTFDPPQGDEPDPRSTPEPSADPTPGTGPSDPSQPGTAPTGAASPGAQPTGGPVGRPGAAIPVETTQPNTGTGQVGGPPPQPLPVEAAPPSTERPPRPTAPVVPFNDGIFESELPVAQGQATRTITETETAMVPGSRTPGGTRNVLREEVNRDGWSAVALSLLLIVCAGHVRRFMGDSSRG